MTGRSSQTAIRRPPINITQYMTINIIVVVVCVWLCVCVCM